MPGQIIKRGERTWLVRVPLGRDASGKRRYHNKTIHGTKRDAEAYLAKKLRERDTGELFEPGRQSLDAFLDSWLEASAARVRPRTLADYKATLRRYVRPYLGAVQVGRITPTDVASLYAKLHAAGLAPRTIRSVHEVLRNALESAVEAGLLRTNPAAARAARKAIPKMPRRERRTVRREELPAFLAAAETAPLGALWAVMLFGGLRPEEALALRWSDLHGDRVRIERVLVQRSGVPLHYEAPKSEASRRTVPLPSAVVALLKAQRKRVAEMRLLAGDRWRDEDLIFPNRHGGPLRRSNIHPAWEAFRQAAGLPRMRMYDLRHSTATLLLEEGVPLKAVAEMLGHASEALVLKTYGHVTAGMREHAAARLDALTNRNAK